METISFINQSLIGLMQLSGLFLIAYSILLWMMFRGVSNAYIYGANTFSKVMHSVLSLCVVSFLSGTFYSIERLPSFLQVISEANPFFYMIDGFRYCFIGQADGSIKLGIIYLIVLSILSWLTAYILFKRGYKIKS